MFCRFVELEKVSVNCPIVDLSEGAVIYELPVPMQHYLVLLLCAATRYDLDSL